MYIKQYQYADNSGNPYERTLPYRALIEFLNGQGSNDFNSIMETNAFSFPKSVGLLRHLLKIASARDSVILDFFSGSATTAHAVMQQNAEDGGRRKFIMVQLPELCGEKSEAYKAVIKISAKSARSASAAQPRRLPKIIRMRSLTAVFAC